MSEVSFAPLAAKLRSSRAEQAITAAAAAVREWRTEMAWAAPALPVSQAWPVEPDLRSLLDPLADSALAAVTMSAAGEAAAPRRSSPGLPVVRGPASIAASARAAVPGAAAPAVHSLPVATRSAATIATARESGASAARVGAWLARHAHLRPASEVEAPAPQTTAPRSATRDSKVVRLAPARPATDSVAKTPDGGTPMPTVAGAIARFQRAYERTPQPRGWMTPAPVDAAAPASAPVASLESALRRPGSTAAAGRSSARPASPAHDTEAAAPLQRLPGVGHQALPGPRSLPATPSSAASHAAIGNDAAAETTPQRHPLAAIGASLARIERRLGAPTSQPEPATEWLADDDALAERIHAILRRQAQRHGIDEDAR